MNIQIPESIWRKAHVLGVTIGEGDCDNPTPHFEYLCSNSCFETLYKLELCFGTCWYGSGWTISIFSCCWNFWCLVFAIASQAPRKRRGKLGWLVTETCSPRSRPTSDESSSQLYWPSTNAKPWPRSQCVSGELNERSNDLRDREG